MYPNLKAELARKGIKLTELSQTTGIPYQTLTSKMSGKTQFTYKETLLIKKALEIDLPLEELFETKVI